MLDAIVQCTGSIRKPWHNSAAYKRVQTTDMREFLTKIKAEPKETTFLAAALRVNLSSAAYDMKTSLRSVGLGVAEQDTHFAQGFFWDERLLSRLCEQNSIGRQHIIDTFFVQSERMEQQSPRDPSSPATSVPGMWPIPGTIITWAEEPLIRLPHSALASIDATRKPPKTSIFVPPENNDDPPSFSTSTSLRGNLYHLKGIYEQHAQNINPSYKRHKILQAKGHTDNRLGLGSGSIAGSTDQSLKQSMSSSNQRSRASARRNLIEHGEVIDLT